MSWIIQTTKVQWVSYAMAMVSTCMCIRYELWNSDRQGIFKHPTLACPKLAVLKWKQYRCPLYGSMARGQPATNRNVCGYCYCIELLVYFYFHSICMYCIWRLNIVIFFNIRSIKHNSIKKCFCMVIYIIIQKKLYMNETLKDFKKKITK